MSVTRATDRGKWMAGPVTIHLTERDRLNNHIPEWAWRLSRTHRVFYEDYEAGELVRILECNEKEAG